MEFDIALHDEARRTRVAITGRMSLGQLASLMQLLAVDSAAWGHEDVLLDFRGLRVLFVPAERELVAHVARCRLRGKSVQLCWPGEE